MILTCPDCATSYFVDDARVPSKGRTVKCSGCGQTWRAMPEGGAAEADLEFAPAEEPVDDLEPAPEAAAELDAGPDDLVVEVAPVDIRPIAAKAANAPRPRLALAGLAVAAGLAGGVGAAAIFRDEVVRLAPAAAPVFAQLGLPANEYGLVIEQVRSQAAFQGGRPVLSVTGAIRNVRGERVEAPALKVSLLDKAGKPLAAKLARPLNAAVPAGARRYFAISIADPPAGAHDLQVVFEPVPATSAALGPSEPVEPEEAKPLPPGSPDALPERHG
jgi:predicted Zn finger-like uncharacterized protein